MFSGCGGEETGRATAAIMNGEYATHPAMGNLNGCGATIIDPYTVLTAAHCVARPGSREFCKNDFRHSSEPDQTSVAVDVHPDYHTNDYHSTVALLVGDIAVVHLGSALVNSPIRMAVHPPVVGDRIAIWGNGWEGPSTPYSDQFKRGEAVVAQVTEEVIISYGPRTEGMPPETAGMCPGDSGGPTITTIGGEDFIVGVHSTNGPYDSNDCGIENWDIRVDKYRLWVEEKIAAYRRGEPASCESESDGKFDQPAPEPGAGAAGGCSVRPSTNGASASLVLALVMLGIALARRRRS